MQEGGRAISVPEADNAEDAQEAGEIVEQGVLQKRGWKFQIPQRGERGALRDDRPQASMTGTRTAARDGAFFVK